MSAGTLDALARAIYEARFAHELPRLVTPYEDLPADAIAVWHRCARAARSASTVSLRLAYYAITEEFDFPGDTEEFCGYWCHECRGHVEADGSGHLDECPCHGVAPMAPRAVKERAVAEATR